MQSNLELIIGPMFSGKSTELIRRIRLLQTIGKKVMVIKPLLDDRYNNDKLTTHNFDTVDCFTFVELHDIPLNTLIKYHTIVVDEGQFFPDLKEIITNWLNNLSINIIVAGLDGDFNREPIGDILLLIPYANKCEKLNSLCNICKDGTEAPFSLRLVNSNDKILVGGSESYIPVCRKHYTNHN